MVYSIAKSLRSASRNICADIAIADMEAFNFSVLIIPVSISDQADHGDQDLSVIRAEVYRERPIS